jgi:hypothetical protein
VPKPPVIIIADKTGCYIGHGLSWSAQYHEGNFRQSAATLRDLTSSVHSHRGSALDDTALSSQNKQRDTGWQIKASVVHIITTPSSSHPG